MLTLTGISVAGNLCWKRKPSSVKMATASSGTPVVVRQLERQLGRESSFYGSQLPTVPRRRGLLLCFISPTLEKAYVHNLNMEGLRYDFWMGLFRMTLMILLSSRYFITCDKEKKLFPSAPEKKLSSNPCDYLWIPTSLIFVGAGHAVTVFTFRDWYIKHREPYIFVDTTLVWIGLALDTYRRLEPNFTAIVRLTVAFVGFATFRYHSPFYSYFYRGLIGLTIFLLTFMLKGNHELSLFAIPICISFLIIVLCYKYDMDKRTRMKFYRRWELSSRNALS